MSEVSESLERSGGALSPDVLDALVAEGDLSSLTPAQRTQYYVARCQAAGLDPRAHPFRYLRFQGKLQLYAHKGCSEQLTAKRGLSIDVLSRDLIEGDLYEVVCRVRDPQGRTSEDIGTLFVGGLEGEALANARMKAVTKAKRRSVLSHCGLGMLDETEAEAIPDARQIRVSETGEIIGAPAEPAPPVQDLAYWRRRAMALYTDLGGNPKDKDACRADLARILGLEPRSRRELTAEEWERCALHMEQHRQAAALAEKAEPSQSMQAALEGGEQGTYAQQMGL